MRIFPLPRTIRWAPLAVAVLGLAACKGTDTATTAAGPADIGGTMVIASPADAGTMLPVLISSNTDREVTDLLYDRLADIGTELVTVGDKGFKPQLAGRWEWAPDSLSITFHLNPAAKWHDGRPVRASDVRFSLALVKNPATGSAISSLVTNVDSVSIRDSLTFVAFFKARTPEQFYELVYQVPIMPEHLLANTPPADLKTSEVSRRGIGSGRFRLAKWAPGQRIELVADTGNYRGRAKLDRVVFSISPDAASSVTRFFAGDADFHEQLRPDNLAQLAKDTVRRLMRYPNLQHAYMAFNLVDPTNPARPHPIFGDRAVRRALSMAVDRRAMLRNVFDTLGQLSYGPFPGKLPVADTTLPQIPYDTAAARALLDSAGWVRGPGGVRVKNGRRLEFGLVVPNSSAPRKAYSVLLQEAFRRVGASVRIEEMDFASFSAKQAAHGFDTEIAAYGADPSVSGFKQAWSSEGMKPGGFNFPSYSNPVVDALLDSASLTFDFARTRSYARRAFEIILEDAPGVWLYEPLTLGGIDRRIRTADLRADSYWANMADWWIPADKRTARDRIGLRPTP
jgi:peptide/nickel transport system substrate-binding protein